MKDKLVLWLTRLSPVQTESLLDRLINALILSIVLRAATTAAIVYLLLR